MMAEATAQKMPNALFEQSREPPPVHVVKPLDSTTPAFSAVTKFMASDIQNYGWVLEKMTAKWPHITALNFPNWVRGYSDLNTVLLLKAPNAVGMLEVFHETPDLTPKIREVFVFHKQGFEDDAIKIYREFKTWARNQGIREIRDVGKHSDVANAKLRSTLNAKTGTGLVFEL